MISNSRNSVFKKNGADAGSQMNQTTNSIFGSLKSKNRNLNEKLRLLGTELPSSRDDSEED